MKIGYKTYLLFGIFVLTNFVVNAQNLTFHRGEIEFYTSSILSDIEAISEKADVQLNLETGEIELTIDINSFEFEYDLMKEHFEEKHMETNKYPQATFKGKITQNIPDEFEEIEIVAKGGLTIHGVTKDIDIEAKISKKDNFFVVKAKHLILFKDYNIDEPSILKKSVAKDVMVKSTLYLK